MELQYKGKNIYPSVKLKECIYDSRCDLQLSHLRIVFQDDNHKFDSYGFELGDKIRVKDGKLDTKTMFINEIHPVNAGYEIVAHPVKKEAMNESDTKKWKSVKFKKIMGEIAKKHGMTAQYFGASNNKYKEIEQDNEKDIMFATRLAILEGCVIVIFDGKMVVASNKYLAKQGGSEQFEIDDYDVSIKTGQQFKKCIVQGKDKTGKYTGQRGSGTLTFKIEISSKAEGNRFAENLLEHNNKDAHTGCVVTDEMMDGYSGGTVVTIKSTDHPSASGDALIYRARHDLMNGKSKLWFRCLEG